MLHRFVAVLLGLLFATAPSLAQQAPGAGAPAVSPGHAGSPLQPLDTSSPRATLVSFLANTDAIGRFYRDVYYHEPTLAHLESLFQSRLRTGLRVFDLNETAPAIRDRVAVEAGVRLYEILSRIDLPPAEAIPGPDEVVGDNPLPRWMVPGTDITLVRVSDGPRRGDYLFSADTVAHVAGHYDLIRALPYRRAVPTADFVQIRHVMGGALIPPRVIEALPDWLRSTAFGMVAWKWAALALLGAAILGLLSLAWTVAARGRTRYREQPAVAAVLRLLMPVAILALATLGTFIANAIINVNDELALPIRIGAETVLHLGGAWIAWVGSLSVAEMVIASPRVAEGTLDAQVLRLFARIIGIVLAVALILVGGEKVGLPLFGLLAGVGIGGLAIALAAQDTLRNLLGSLMIFFDQPYRAGDHIIVLDYDGRVEQIGLRSTRIRLLNARLVTIPNEKMASAEIVNVSRRTCIRRETRLGLSYDTPPERIERAVAVVREVLDGHAAHWADMPPRVYFETIGQDGLEVVAHTWFHPPNHWDCMATHERINLRLLTRFAEEGLAFAVPSTITLLEPGSKPIAVELRHNGERDGRPVPDAP